MTTINTNIPSLIAQRTLRNNNMGLNKSLERLSTGLRINRGADDPAGLIASENLRSDQASIKAAIGNAQRADQVMNVAEGGLQEVNSLMVELQGIIGASANEAGLSQEEKEANQLQIDSILNTIDRIANATSFQGTKLLNGGFDYTTSSVNSTLLSDVTINSAKLPTTTGSFMSVSVDVLTSAQTATIYMSMGTSFDASGTAYTVEISGTKGTQQLTFASGTSMGDMVSAVNQFKDVTGVSAASSGTLMQLNSSDFGTDAFVSAKNLSGNRANLIKDENNANGDNNKKDLGRDAVVLINGTQATTDGLTGRVTAAGLDVSINIDGASALNTTGGNTSFTVTGGGATFSLAPDVNLAGKVSLGIQSVTSGNIGSGTAGFLSALKSGGSSNVVNGDLDQAQSIVDAGIKQISSLRGRIGAFQSNVVGATIRNLGVTLENTASAESQIRDTDFASETAAMTRSQILQQAATQSLQIANNSPQSVLALIG